MNFRPETLAVRAGHKVDPETKALASPIYQTATFGLDSTQYAEEVFSLKRPGYVYGRFMGPNQNELEQRISALGGGVGALATGSGAAAITYAILNLATVGSNFISSAGLYGGTFALFSHTLAQYGIEVRFADPAHPEKIAELVDEKTVCVYAESLANPSLTVLDIQAWADAAHSCGLPLLVDNTIPTPFLERVFDHGADVALHSATKYLSGHGAVVAGLIVDSGKFDWSANPDRFKNFNRPDPAYHGIVWTETAGECAFINRTRTVLERNMGATLAPFAAWQVCQGIETLHLRMERHSQNALQVATYLTNHPDVAWVKYPGLPDSDQKAKADKYFTGHGYGGIVSFGLKTGRAGGRDFIDNLKLLCHVANIGDAKSLAIHNASTTHSQLSDEELAEAGVPADLVRLSIGIEHIDDIISDIEQAIEKVH